MPLATDVNVDELYAGAQRAEDALENNIPVALNLAADLVAAEAKSNHDYQDRTSILTNSIANAGVEGSLKGGTLEATVGAGAKYGIFVEAGTRPHLIKPRFKKALRIPIEGGFAFVGAVQHPGTKAYLFLSNAIERKGPEIDETVVDAVTLSFAQAGFE
jgi:HK97 gp10 family phage protein